MQTKNKNNPFAILPGSVDHKGATSNSAKPNLPRSLNAKSRISRSLLLTGALLLAASPNGAAGNPIVTEVQSPFDASDRLRQTQSHFWYDKDLQLAGSYVNAYHAGEDWANGATGAALRAIADGQVVKTGYSSTFGNYVRIGYEFPYGGKLYSDYVHCRDSTSALSGDVKKGDVVASVGNTGVGTGAHLHWGMTRTNSVGILENPYHNGQRNGIDREPLTPSRGMKYVAPSLVLADWSNQKKIRVIPGWPPKEFEVDVSVPWWLVFVTDDNGDVYSLSEAVDEGVIQYGVIRKQNGKWYRWTDPNKAYISQTGEYGILSTERCTLHICEPSHSDEALAMRAMQDIFLAARVERFEKRRDRVNMKRWYDWDDDWSAFMCLFDDRHGDVAAVLQYTHKAYPFIRYTRAYKDGKWDDFVTKVNRLNPSY